MAQYLVDFRRLDEIPGDQNSVFSGRVVIEAEDSKTSIKEFLEWVQNREEFNEVSHFVFKSEKLEIVSGTETEDA